VGAENFCKDGGGGVTAAVPLLVEINATTCANGGVALWISTAAKSSDGVEACEELRAFFFKVVCEACCILDSGLGLGSFFLH